VSDYYQSIFSLAKRGYGSVNELMEWDTAQFLDAVEWENICIDIEQDAMNGNS